MKNYMYMVTNNDKVSYMSLEWMKNYMYMVTNNEKVPYMSFCTLYLPEHVV